MESKPIQQQQQQDQSKLDLAQEKFEKATPKQKQSILNGIGQDVKELYEKQPTEEAKLRVLQQLSCGFVTGASATGGRAIALPPDSKTGGSTGEFKNGAVAPFLTLRKWNEVANDHVFDLVPVDGLDEHDQMLTSAVRQIKQHLERSRSTTAFVVNWCIETWPPGFSIHQVVYVTSSKQFKCTSPPATSMVLRACQVCKKLDGSQPFLKACSKCHDVLYCSTKCQATDWSNTHKFLH